MDEKALAEIMAQVETAIQDAGYDPYEQLVGYLKTGQDYYITRRENARGLIKKVNRCWLNHYVYEILRRRNDID